jgi:hypothetical protein
VAGIAIFAGHAVGCHDVASNAPVRRRVLASSAGSTPATRATFAALGVSMATASRRPQSWCLRHDGAGIPLLSIAGADGRSAGMRSLRSAPCQKQYGVVSMSLRLLPLRRLYAPAALRVLAPVTRWEAPSPSPQVRLPPSR